MISASRMSHQVALSRLAFFVAVSSIIVFASLPLAAQETRRNLLVNFDFARTYAARRSPQPYLRNMPGLDKNAAMPYAWAVQPGGGPTAETIGAISPVQVDGGAALHVVTRKSETMRLRQFVEVVPEASYTCAVWIKGKGTVTVHPSAQAPAAGQDLGEVNGQATANWTEVRLPVKIGYHRHVACLNIDIGENTDVLVRGAEFSALLPAGQLPEDLVAAKPGRDENTVYFEDFGGTSCTFNVGKDCKLTADNGGRFGRGLSVTPTSGGAKARSAFRQAARDRDDRVLVQAYCFSRSRRQKRRQSGPAPARPDDPGARQAVDLCRQWVLHLAAFRLPERALGQ